MSRGRSLTSMTFYLLSKNMDHGRYFRQMHLCADFHAGPSKEYLIFFLFIDDSLGGSLLHEVKNLIFVFLKYLTSRKKELKRL